MLSAVNVLLLAAAAAPAVALRGSASVTAWPQSFSGIVAPTRVTWTFPSSDDPSGCFIATFPVSNGVMPNVSAIPAQGYPATAPWLATAPMHFLTCDTNTSFGEGNPTASWELNVYNARFDVAVGLFSGGIDAPALVAWSNVITVLDKDKFMHAKLARWQQEDQMVVQFQAKALHQAAGVRYGLTASNLDSFAPATTSTYNQSSLCDPSPASTWGWHDPGWFYRSVLEKLPTDGKTKVFYQFGSDDNGWSDIRNFTATMGADPTKEVNVILIADKGVSMTDNSSQHWTEPQAYITAAGIAKHARQGYNLVMHSGDVAYATGMELKWDAFEAEMDQVYTTGAPYMVGLGNHEEDGKYGQDKSFTYYSSGDSGGECGVPTRSRFPIPPPTAGQEPAPPGTVNPSGVFYSLNYGPVHFLMWDTEVDVAEGTEQWNWIKSDLASVNRTDTPWVVVFGHRPIYWNNDRDSHLGAVEPLLDAYNVSLSLYGHVHNAQLYCPFPAGSNGTRCARASPNGPYVGVVHSVIGNAGMSLSPFDKWLDNRTVYHAYEHGYSTLTASATSLTMRYYSDNTLKLHYNFTMTQSYPPKF